MKIVKKMKKNEKNKKNSSKIFILQASSISQAIWFEYQIFLYTQFFFIRVFLHSIHFSFFFLKTSFTPPFLYLRFIFNQQQSMRNNVNLQIVIFWTILPFKF